MKILYVTGNDYTALDFHRSRFTPKQVVEMIESGEDAWATVAQEIDDSSIKFKIFEFDNVDEKFIEFVRNYIQDYEGTKQSEFYAIEE